jgi:hypothetical protein
MRAPPPHSPFVFHSIQGGSWRRADAAFADYRLGMTTIVQQ